MEGGLSEPWPAVPGERPVAVGQTVASEKAEDASRSREEDRGERPAPVAVARDLQGSGSTPLSARLYFSGRWSLEGERNPV